MDIEKLRRQIERLAHNGFDRGVRAVKIANVHLVFDEWGCVTTVLPRDAVPRAPKAASP